MCKTTAKSFLPFASVLFVLLALSLCPEGASARLVDRVVAVVNNDIVKLSELEMAIAPYVRDIKSQRLDPEKEQELIFKVREEAISGLVERKLVDQETQRLGIKLDEKDLDAYIEQIKLENKMTDEDVQMALKAQDITMEAFRKGQRESLLRARLMEREVSSRIVITAEDIKKFYEENRDRFEGKNTYHIWTISTDPKTGGEGRQRLSEARTALAQSASITDVAKNYESGQPAVDVYDLGLWNLSDLAPFYQEKIAVMKVGEVSGILETENGFVVLYLDSIKKTAGKTLIDASPEIRRILHSKAVNERYMAWVASMKKKAYIKIIR